MVSCDDYVIIEMETKESMKCGDHDLLYQYYCFDCPEKKKFLCVSCLDDHGKIYKRTGEGSHKCAIFRNQAERVVIPSKNIGLESIETDINKHFDERKKAVGEVLKSLKDNSKLKEALEDFKNIKECLNEILTKLVLNTLEPIKGLEDFYQELTEEEFYAKTNIREYKNLSDEFSTREEEKLFYAFKKYPKLEELRAFLTGWKGSKDFNIGKFKAQESKVLRDRQNLLNKLKIATNDYAKKLTSILNEVAPRRETIREEIDFPDYQDGKSMITPKVEPPEGKDPNSDEESEVPTQVVPEDHKIKDEDNFFGAYYYWYPKRKALYLYHTESEKSSYIQVLLPGSDMEDNMNIFSDKAESILINDSLLICGGGNDYEIYPDTYIVTFNSPNDTSANAKRVKNMKGGRMEHSLAILKEKVFAIGGKAGTDGEMLSTVEYFENSTWKSAKNMPKAIYGTAVCTFDNKIYVFSGNTGKKSVSLSIYSFDFEDEWRELEPFSSKDYANFSVAVPYRGYILLFGGRLGANCCFYDTKLNKHEVKEELKLPGSDKDCRRNSGMILKEKVFLLTKQKMILNILTEAKWKEVPPIIWRNEENSTASSAAADLPSKFV